MLTHLLCSAQAPLQSLPVSFLSTHYIYWNKVVQQEITKKYRTTVAVSLFITVFSYQTAFFVILQMHLKCGKVWTWWVDECVGSVGVQWCCCSLGKNFQSSKLLYKHGGAMWGPVDGNDLFYDYENTTILGFRQFYSNPNITLNTILDFCWYYISLFSIICKV